MTPGNSILAPMNTSAVAYYRTSSAANVGDDKDSLARQQDAVRAYAQHQGLTIVQEFYDAAVSGADPVMSRPGFAAMLSYMLGNGARAVLVENASRFARDLAVQIAGHDLLKGHGITLVPVDAPNHFQDETPTATMVRSILGAVSQFEKEALVLKLRKARDRKSAALGRRIEGNPRIAQLRARCPRLIFRQPRPRMAGDCPCELSPPSWLLPASSAAQASRTGLSRSS